MQCHQGHAVNREKRRFCEECGAPLTRACLRVLKMAQHISNPSRLWRTHLSMGKFYFDNGELQKSEAFIQIARDVVRQALSGIRKPALLSAFENSLLIREFYENC